MLEKATREDFLEGMTAELSVKKPVGIKQMKGLWGGRAEAFLEGRAPVSQREKYQVGNYKHFELPEHEIHCREWWGIQEVRGGGIMDGLVGHVKRWEFYPTQAGEPLGNYLVRRPFPVLFTVLRLD